MNLSGHVRHIVPPDDYWCDRTTDDGGSRAKADAELPVASRRRAPLPFGSASAFSRVRASFAIVYQASSWRARSKRSVLS